VQSRVIALVQYICQNVFGIFRLELIKSYSKLSPQTSDLISMATQIDCSMISYDRQLRTKHGGDNARSP
jgi:hypothetical protein